MTTFWRSVRAECFIVRTRTSSWSLLVILTAMSVLFGYVLPYAFFRSDGPEFEGSLALMLPQNAVQMVSQAVPFYGGTIALIFGVMGIGSEFGWGTWKTVLTQGPNRSTIYSAKVVAWGLALIPAWLVMFASGLVSSTVIALVEGEAMSLPPVVDMLGGLAAGWLVLAVWMSLGVMLAMVTRGTSIAITLGILWALVMEGLLGNFLPGIGGLGWVVDGLIRANGYSLMQSLNSTSAFIADGPGTFSGPFVGTGQAILVLGAYITVFLGSALVLLKRRDVA
jgi:ABC-type transport system involved in multi-copper enzyme maturation permease subunit